MLLGSLQTSLAVFTGKVCCDAVKTTFWLDVVSLPEGHADCSTLTLMSKQVASLMSLVVPQSSLGRTFICMLWVLHTGTQRLCVVGKKAPVHAPSSWPVSLQHAGKNVWAPHAHAADSAAALAHNRNPC